MVKIKGIGVREDQHCTLLELTTRELWGLNRFKDERRKRLNTLVQGNNEGYNDYQNSMGCLFKEVFGGYFSNLRIEITHIFNSCASDKIETMVEGCSTILGEKSDPEQVILFPQFWFYMNGDIEATLSAKNSSNQEGSVMLGILLDILNLQKPKNPDGIKEFVLDNVNSVTSYIGSSFIPKITSIEQYFNFLFCLNEIKEKIGLENIDSLKKLKHAYTYGTKDEKATEILKTVYLSELNRFTNKRKLIIAK